MRNAHGNVEFQGQRLSSYALLKSNNEETADLSNKYCKLETQKCSCDIGNSAEPNKSIPTDIVKRKEHTSTQHVISNHRHSLPLQNKSNDLSIICNCNLLDDTAADKSVSTDERIPNKFVEDSKIMRGRKEKRDAATSPQLSIRNSGKGDVKLEPKTYDKNLKVNENPCLLTPVRPSPRREIPTRNAATSPHIDTRKQTIINSSDYNSIPKHMKTVPSKIILEKSKSLSETRPQRQLRTTRSLSPRPPIRHQQAIIVSDENDIVLKITPSEDFDFEDTVLEKHTLRKTKVVHKARSEQTSPNIYESDAFFAEDRFLNNRSTGCLVYVPSDPWLKMTDKDKIRPKHKNKNSNFKSSPKSNFANDENDPWIYRRTDNKRIQNSPKALLNRQTQSMSCTIEDKAKQTPNRPKLQRCKSPTVADDAFIQNDFKKWDEKSFYHNIQNNVQTDVNLKFSPQRIPPPVVNINSEKCASNFLLNVSNPNMLQPRHSFSSLSQKDDELQLNIRRLSEQMKAPGIMPTATPSADFSTYLNHIKMTASTSNPSIDPTTRNDVDLVLETTC